MGRRRGKKGRDKTGRREGGQRKGEEKKANPFIDEEAEPQRGPLTCPQHRVHSKSKAELSANGPDLPPLCLQLGSPGSYSAT